MSDPINPKHYKEHPSGIECIDVVRYFSFNIGNVIKYLWRAGKKDDILQEYKKALFYLKDEIKKLENEIAKDTRPVIDKNEKSCDCGERGNHSKGFGCNSTRKKQY